MRNKTIETVEEIRKKLKVNPSIEDLLRWNSDPRKGVQTALEQYSRRRRKEDEEHKRIRNLFRYEEELYKEGYALVAGTDEAGRGPVAGPVTVAAVILPREWYCEGLNDSKKISRKKREKLFEMIRKESVAYSIVHVSAAEIDSENIYQAVVNGMIKATGQLNPYPDYLLSDAMPLTLSIPVQPLIKGDAKSGSIAAASILAKVSRDRLMELYDKEYPEYGFALHKGYLTEAHQDALQKYGPTIIHRKSFEPIKSMMINEEKR